MAEFGDILISSTDTVAATALRMRAAILERFPAAIEQIDLGDCLAAYGATTRMRDLALAIVPHSSHVNLQLGDGVDLPDPAGLVEGTGKRIRHVKCRSPEDVDRPAVLALIEEQARRRS